MANTVLNYYDTAWNDPNILNIQKLLSDDVRMEFMTFDEVSDGLMYEGKDNIMNHYVNWDKIVKRLETKKIKFDLKDMGDNTFMINYEINQPYKLKFKGDTSSLIKLVMEDLIHVVENENGEFLIDKIDTYRFERVCL